MIKFIILIIFITCILLFFFKKKEQFNNNIIKFNSNIIKINKNYTVKNLYQMTIIENVLQKESLDYLKKLVENKDFKTKNMIFRKGGGIPFKNLKEKYPDFVYLYQSKELLNIISKALNNKINNAPEKDINRCSLLTYLKKGDFIGWHYDTSMYKGNRYVALLPIINRNKTNTGLSKNEFIFVNEQNKQIKLKLYPNNMYIFKGSEVNHKSTSIGDGEKRILLSMTFCDNCKIKNNYFLNLLEKIKNKVIY